MLHQVFKQQHKAWPFSYKTSPQNTSILFMVSLATIHITALFLLSNEKFQTLFSCHFFGNQDYWRPNETPSRTEEKPLNWRLLLEGLNFSCWWEVFELVPWIHTKIEKPTRPGHTTTFRRELSIWVVRLLAWRSPPEKSYYTKFMFAMRWRILSESTSFTHQRWSSD